jgi:hypothetical protein
MLAVGIAGCELLERARNSICCAQTPFSESLLSQQNMPRGHPTYSTASLPPLPAATPCLALLSVGGFKQAMLGLCCQPIRTWT